MAKPLLWTIALLTVFSLAAPGCKEDTPKPAMRQAPSATKAQQQPASAFGSAASCQLYAEAVCDICGRTEEECQAAKAKFHKCSQGKNCQHKVCSKSLEQLKQNKPADNKKQLCGP